MLLEGNVALKIENLLFKADKVNLDKKNKVFSSEKISFSTLDDFLYGQTKFVSITEDETVMKNVEFSSCPCEDKIWWIEYSQGIDDYYNRKFVQAKKKFNQIEIYNKRIKLNIIYIKLKIFFKQILKK